MLKSVFQVYAIVADGLAANRSMFKCMGANEDTPHKTINWFSDQERSLFLIPDPPHLLKTTRNCLYSSRDSGTPRLIHCNEKFILWKHIEYVESQNVSCLLACLSKKRS